MPNKENPKLIYKCKLCGERFLLSSPTPAIVVHVVQALRGKESSVALTEVHLCAEGPYKGNTGLAELIGWQSQ